MESQQWGPCRDAADSVWNPQECSNQCVDLVTLQLERLGESISNCACTLPAGHAAALLGSTLYVVGGGNNAAGCADMYSLDLSQLPAGEVAPFEGL
jgi:hypothetical protein